MLTIRRRRKPRRGPLRSPKYVAWCHTQPCACCRRPYCDHAHVGIGGMRMKCADNEGLPLCRSCHENYHSRDGRRGKAIEERFGVRLMDLAKEHYGRFVAEKAGRRVVLEVVS